MLHEDLLFQLLMRQGVARLGMRERTGKGMRTTDVNPLLTREPANEGSAVHKIARKPIVRPIQKLQCRYKKIAEYQIEGGKI